MRVVAMDTKSIMVIANVSEKYEYERRPTPL